MGGFFKKPKPQEQASGNYAYNDISSAYKPALGYVTQGGDMLANLLGVGSGGTAAQTGALDNFAHSGGMDWLMEQGNRMINSNQAAKGLLSSGSTLKGIEKYGQGLGSTYLSQYMDKLLGLGNLGLGAGGVLAQAGQWSKGQGPTQGGMGKTLLPMVASAALKAIPASDPRLKENIIPIGNMRYRFNYRQDTPLNLPEGTFEGYLADELPAEAVTMKDGYLHVVDKKYFPKKVS
jgi:hypothetical protein